MSTMKFNRVAQLPAVLQPGAFYFVSNGAYTESYLTDSAGNAKMIGNSAMINALVGPAVAAALASFSTLQVTATIATRNQLPTNASYLALVVDASADTTNKTAGSALYAYDKPDGKWVKVADYGSLDVALSWANLQGGPASTPAQIDLAVTQSHTHANKAVLDQLSTDADGLLLNGAGIDPRWANANW